MYNDKLKPVISSPFVETASSVSKVMQTVIYSLIPAIALFNWFFGWGVLVNIVLAILSALTFESIMLYIRGKPVKLYLRDGSAILTAILLALALPPMTPWWIPVAGTFFAIVVAKQLYGGIGYNIFNPAMAAYAILLISFPLELSTWSAPVAHLQNSLTILDTLNYSFFHTLPASLSYDALTSATLLDYVKTQTGIGKSIAEVAKSPIFGNFAATGFEWVNLAILSGGLWLLYKKIISWHIPVAMLLSISLISLLFYILNPNIYLNPLVHLFSGASILGAFFIATDPVTAATTQTGKLLYGAGIGLLTYAIRVWGGYPDGIAFAVLLMGLLVPLIDYYTLPKVYGKRKMVQ